jgi:PilZ domain-containing protein
MTISKNQAVRLKFITESMARMLNASHRASGHHSDTDCTVCIAIERSQGAISDLFERRGAPRRALVTSVRGRGSEGARFKTRLSDLSETGAFLESVLPFREGTVLDLTFRVKARELKVKSEVCYSIEHVGAGVRFIEIEPDDRRAIAACLNTD